MEGGGGEEVGGRKKGGMGGREEERETDGGKMKEMFHNSYTYCRMHLFFPTALTYKITISTN